MVVNNPNGMIGWRQITKDIFHGEMLADMIFDYLSKRFEFDSGLLSHDECDEIVSIGNMLITLGEAEKILEAMRAGAHEYEAELVAVGVEACAAAENAHSMFEDGSCVNLQELIDMIELEDLEEAIRQARDTYRTNRDTLGFYLPRELELMLIESAGDKELWLNFLQEYNKWWNRYPSQIEFAYHIASELGALEFFYKTFPVEKSQEMQVGDSAFYSTKEHAEYIVPMMEHAMRTMGLDEGDAA